MIFYDLIGGRGGGPENPEIFYFMEAPLPQLGLQNVPIYFSSKVLTNRGASIK